MSFLYSLLESVTGMGNKDAKKDDNIRTPSAPPPSSVIVGGGSGDSSSQQQHPYDREYKPLPTSGGGSRVEPPPTTGKDAQLSQRAMREIQKTYKKTQRQLDHMANSFTVLAVDDMLQQRLYLVAQHANVMLSPSLLVMPRQELLKQSRLGLFAHRTHLLGEPVGTPSTVSPLLALLESQADQSAFHKILSGSLLWIAPILKHKKGVPIVILAILEFELMELTRRDLLRAFLDKIKATPAPAVPTSDGSSAGLETIFEPTQRPLAHMDTRSLEEKNESRPLADVDVGATRVHGDMQFAKRRAIATSSAAGDEETVSITIDPKKADAREDDEEEEDGDAYGDDSKSRSAKKRRQEKRAQAAVQHRSRASDPLAHLSPEKRAALLRQYRIQTVGSEHKTPLSIKFGEDPPPRPLPAPRQRGGARPSAAPKKRHKSGVTMESRLKKREESASSSSSESSSASSSSSSSSSEGEEKKTRDGARTSSGAGVTKKGQLSMANLSGSGSGSEDSSFSSSSTSSDDEEAVASEKVLVVHSVVRQRHTTRSKPAVSAAGRYLPIPTALMQEATGQLSTPKASSSEDRRSMYRAIGTLQAIVRRWQRLLDLPLAEDARALALWLQRGTCEWLDIDLSIASIFMRTDRLMSATAPPRGEEQHVQYSLTSRDLLAWIQREHETRKRAPVAVVEPPPLSLSALLPSAFSLTPLGGNQEEEMQILTLGEPDDPEEQAIPRHALPPPPAGATAPQPRTRRGGAQQVPLAEPLSTGSFDDFSVWQ
jgi:hypothetical protein